MMEVKRDGIFARANVYRMSSCGSGIRHGALGGTGRMRSCAGAGMRGGSAASWQDGTRRLGAPRVSGTSNKARRDGAGVSSAGRGWGWGGSVGSDALCVRAINHGG